MHIYIHIFYNLLKQVIRDCLSGNQEREMLNSLQDYPAGFELAVSD